MMDNIMQAELEISRGRHQKRKLEAELQQNAKLAAVGELAAGVAHELGAPLSLVDAKMQRALRAPDLTAHADNVLRSIRQEVARMARIIRELLDFSGRNPIERRRITAGSLLHDALETITPEAEKTGTRVEIRPFPVPCKNQSVLRISSNSLRRCALVSGYAICKLLSVSTTIWETIKRAFFLSSAGIAYQGATSVLVALRHCS